MTTLEAELIDLCGANNVRAYIVIVFGIDSHHSHELGPGPRRSWQESLPASGVSRCGFLLYDHKLGSEQSWSVIVRRIFQRGRDLVNALVGIDNGELKHPIIFICHSLGGLIVKQALWYARQQDHCRILDKFTSGLIFLGTPHSGQRDERRWRALLLSLSSNATRKSKWPLPNLEDLDLLARISFQFEEIDSHFPILSAYESMETKLPDRRLFKSKPTMLVGRGFGLTHARHEECLVIPGDYHKIFQLTIDDIPYQRILTFLRSALDNSKSGCLVACDTVHNIPIPKLVTSKSPKMAPSCIQESLASGSPQTTDEAIKADFIISRKGPRLPCRIFKSRLPNRRFFGRASEIDLLEKALLPPESEHSGQQELRTFALCGLGGVGKTEIAVEFMFKHRDKFDAVIWLQADEISKLAEEYSQIAVEMGLQPDHDAFDQDVSRKVVKGWLENPKRSMDPSDPASSVKASWLLIFDNVEDPDTLKEFWPSFGSGSILITSRNPSARNHGFAAAASGANIEPFNADGAARFLVRLTNQGEEDDPELLEEATEIATRLGGLPLAITQMAAIIESRTLSFREFLDDFHESKLEEFHALLQQPLQLGRQMRGYEHSLASVFAFERLELGASALLDVISILDSGPIEENLLQASGPKVKLENYPTSRSDYRNARSILIHSSLVTRNSKSGMLLVHRLTQDVARSKMNPARFQAVFEAGVVLVSELWRPEPLHRQYDTTRWREREAILPHVWRLRNLYNNDFVATTRFASLLNNAAWYFHERGKSEDHDQFASMAQRICESQPRQDDDVRRLLIDIHYCRGSEASESNQPQLCFEQFSALLMLSQQISSENGRHYEDLASAYNEVGVAYMMNNQYDEGMKAFHKSINVYENLEHFTTDMAAFPLTNLGLSLWLQGRCGEAAEVLHKALIGREETYGHDDKESEKTGRILLALGNVYESQGDLNRSFDFHKRSLAQFRSTVGHSNHRIADVCHKMAGHYMRMGKLESAKKLLDQALRVYSGRERLKPEQARTSFRMGKLLRLLEDEESTDYFTKAFSIYQVLKGDDKAASSLEETDFDDLVAFWTR